MKKILAYIIVFALSACSSTHTNVPSGALQEKVEARHVAYVSVGEKISGVSSSHVLLGFLRIAGDNNYADGVTYSGAGQKFTLPFNNYEERTKSAAAYKAIKSSGADVIVAPTYFTRVTNFFYLYTIYKARVDGYKGTIDGFQQVVK